jgi:hypothetical protein
MQTVESDELFGYLDQIVNVTKAGKINWVQANPTTYMWNFSTPQAGRVIIQKISAAETFKNPNGTPGIRPVVRFLLQAIDKTGGVKLALNGAENVAINQRLQSVFETIEATIAQRGIDFLKSIIPPT